MRIEGYFGRFGAPYIEAALICEKFGIKKSIKFLVDSGASRTTISENDAIRMGIDYSKLEKTSSFIHTQSDLHIQLP